MSEARTHWLITYVLANDTRIVESTRERGMDAMTEAEVKDGLEDALSLMGTRGGPRPAVWVKDRVRDGQPTLLFTRQLLAVELTRDEGDLSSGNYGPGQPRLRAVQEPGEWDPPHRGPDPWRDPRAVRPVQSDRLTGRDPSLPWNKNVVPAGPDRHA